MLNDPEAGKRIVKEALQGDPEDILSAFDRGIVGGKSVRIDFPLRDPTECYRHLEMLEETCRAIRFQLQHKKKDRSQLFLVRGMLRQLHKKINAYRSGRSD